MSDRKEPTPIPLRASRKQTEPIMFPTVRYGSNTTPVDANLNPIDTPIADITEARIRALVAECVREQLREHDMRLIRTLHKVVMDWPIAEIMTMGEAEFIALYRSLLQDEDNSET